jgi:hypothetical protein
LEEKDWRIDAEINEVRSVREPRDQNIEMQQRLRQAKG